MTVIENLNPRIQYNGPIEINDALSINFPYTNTEDVKCVANNEQLVYNRDYTILEQTLTIKIAIPQGQTITIYRSTPLDQQAEFPQNNKFNSEKMNEALDKICMQQQEQVEESRRSMRAPISVINFDGQLPIPIPGRSLKINEDGTGFVLTEYDSDEAYGATEQFKQEAQQARNEAITQAGIATTQAGIATTQANNAATSAAQAESILNSATDTIEQEEQKAINNILAQQQTSINTIEQEGLNVVQTIEGKQDDAVALLQNAADDNIEVMNSIKTETAQFLNSAEQEAEKAANSAQQANTAKQETQSILETATNTIDAEEAAALNAIASNKSNALTDIQTNQQSAITAIGNSRNAAVNAVVTQQNTSVNMVSAQQTTSVNAVQNQEASSIASIQNQEAITINNVEASGQNYINKCKDWATSDNIVEDGLRSAKYYAEQAQNISGITYEQLRSSNAYENNGALLTDEEGYADILKMKNDDVDGAKTGIDIVEGIEIPYTISKTGAKIVSAEYRDNVIELYEKTGQANYYTLDTEKTINCTVLGTPTVNDSIVSSFTADNYLTIPKYTSIFKDNSWSIETKQQYLTSDSTQFKGLSLSTDDPPSGFLGIYGSSAGFYYSVGGAYHDIKTTLSEIGASNNSWVHLKVVFEIDTKQCSVFAAINNDEFTLIRSEVLVDQIDFVQEDVTPIINCFNSVGMLYGATMPFDLNYLNIEINSEKIFSGMKVPNFTLPMGNIYGLIRQNSDTLATKVNEDDMIEVDFADAGSYIAGCAMPSNEFVELTLGETLSTYTAPANGWFAIYMSNAAEQTAGHYVHLHNTTAGDLGNSACSSDNSWQPLSASVPAKKGDVIQVTYLAATQAFFRFVYAQGSESEVQ